MSASVPFAVRTPAAAATQGPPSGAGGRRSRLGACWRAVHGTGVFAWKYLLGMLFCQQFLSSILVVGWSYRLMQRTALKRWWRRSPRRDEGLRFTDFLAQCETSPPGHWPNWILGQRPAAPADGTRGLLRPVAQALLGSLWLNFRLGVQGLFNIWVLTLPACALWLFAWHAGWNNSFHKGYEQAWVGPLTGSLGVAWFIAAMFYVPIAQARQAATVSCRAFYDVSIVWRLASSRWFGCLLLALLAALLSLPVSILKTAPAFFPQIHPALEEATDAELLQLLKRYYLLSAAVVFPCFVLLKLAAARLYASALLAAIHRGSIGRDALHPAECQALERLGLLDLPQRRRRHGVTRTVAGTARLARGAVLAVATFLVWFSFVAQIFVGEFLNYHPLDTPRGYFPGGWMNQPLIQLPWFNYTPSALKTGAPPTAAAESSS